MTTNGRPDIRGQSYSAAKLAAEAINQNLTLLSDYLIEIVPFDDLRSLGNASKFALDTVLDTNSSLCVNTTSGGRRLSSRLRQNDSVAVIGPFFSALCSSVAKILAPFRVSQLSPTCADSNLSDKTTYPYFGRVTYTSKQETNRMLSIVKTMGWDRFVLLTDGTELSKSAAKSFASIAADYDMKMIRSFVVSDGSDYAFPLRVFRALNARVILTYGTDAVSMAKTMVEAQKLGMLEYPYVWLHSSSIATSLFIDNTLVRDIVYNISFAGHLYVANYIYTDNAQAQAFLKKWQSIKDENDTQKWPGTQFNDLTVATVPSYDAVFIYANILSRMIANKENIYRGDLLVRYLKGLVYNGVIGKMTFDQNMDMKGDNMAGFYVSPNGTSVRFADIRNEEVKRIAYPIYSNGFQGDIDDSPPITVSYVSNGLYVFFVAFTSVLIVFSFGLLFFVFFNWETLRSQSPIFLTWIVMSNISLLSAVYVMGLDGGVTSTGDHLCIIRPWLFGIPFVMAISSLLAKNIRIWIIFLQVQTLDVPNINAIHMTLLTLVPVVIEVVILITWTVLSPLEMIMEFQTEFTATEYCSTTSPVFLSIYFGYKALLLAAGVLVAYKTKNIISKFNEARIIGYTMYNCFVVMVIIVPIIIIQRTQINLAFALASIGIILIGFVNNLIIFVPKIFMIFKPPASISSSNKVTSPN
eukprot:TRINITY_DN3475_c0_g1_i1.p1 TRINITY_DN3475_c0_g1~~TRINITY_DN3475_c0_g1_i1.p1  ORF type:complete len:738 (+),score=154.35 TRINITY_DN3475_c0_g1_i1:133-2214(+)